MLIDSHCHLDHFSEEEREDILDRAEAAGLSGLVTISTKLSQASQILALTRHSRPNLRIWCTVGTHPDHAGEEVLPEPAELAALTSDPAVIGFGESGLDYHHGEPPVRERQQRGFRAHIRAARMAGLPLVIHARSADDDVAAILRDEHESGGAFLFLLHCFSSSESLARTGLELGGYISFSGILTFPKSDELRRIAAAVPEDRLLVETDAPYLTPVPKRGRRNEPSFVTHTAARLAELRGLSPSQLAERTTANFRRLFARAA